MSGRNSDRGYYLTDGLGSVAAVTDSAGTLGNRYTYSPNGETTQTFGMHGIKADSTGRRNTREVLEVVIGRASGRTEGWARRRRRRSGRRTPSCAADE